jgi:hypothetical protein
LAASAVEGLQSGQFIEPKLHGPAAERAARARSINVHDAPRLPMGWLAPRSMICDAVSNDVTSVEL